MGEMKEAIGSAQIAVAFARFREWRTSWIWARRSLSIGARHIGMAAAAGGAAAAVALLLMHSAA